MRETEVLEHVSKYLNERDYLFFIDTGYPQDVVSNLTTSIENCQANRTITIGRRIPDIIGFTNEREIFAIEVKGEEAIRKGIGQAAHYRQGVHVSYLAASRSALAEFRETALSCGLGVISTDESENIQRKKPVTNIGATNIDRTRRALAVKTSRFQSSQTTFPSLSRPEKGLLPVITIITHENRDPALNVGGRQCALNEQTVEEELSKCDKTFNQIQPAISLAITQQLIRKSNAGPDERSLELTDSGRSAFYLIAGLAESHNELDLYDYIGGMNREKYLYDTRPELASFLRDRYLTLPDIRLLVYVLASHNGARGELSMMLAETALSSPDAFLNLFCGQGKEEEFRKLVEKSHPDADSLQFRQHLLDISSANSLYNFLYQIRAIGILGEGTTPVHQDEKDLDIGDHYWEWDPNRIGEIGAESF